MMFAALASGHTDLADVFFLVAMILFGLAALTTIDDRSVRGEGVLVPLGLAFMAAAFFVQ